LSASPRVGLLWRREWDPPSADPPRLAGVFAAFADIGVAAEAVVYSDDAVDAVREQLLALDGVLVWANPIEQGLDRSLLDPLLREVANEGVFVSAHPDVILCMGTKEVLVATRELSWSADNRIHRSLGELRKRLESLDGPLVFKQHRGIGGGGVWKVEPTKEGELVVQHAAGGAAPERLPLDGFLAICEPYFAGAGLMVEQPYQTRLPEGLIRAYHSHDKVVGWTHQYPRGLLLPGLEPAGSGKAWDKPDDPRYASLRERLESEWVPEMQRTLDLTTERLPVIWDADFLYGEGEDEWVLCEINVSSTFAFPEFAMPRVASATLEQIGARPGRRST
jgi:hypothetical protein